MLIIQAVNQFAVFQGILIGGKPAARTSKIQPTAAPVSGKSPRRAGVPYHVIRVRKAYK
jgi:hypothetical protein